MPLGLPAKDDTLTKIKPLKTDQRRTVTIILGDKDRVKWYHGLLDAPEVGGAPTTTDYTKDGIRKELLKRVQSIPEVMGDKDKGMIVIIKPTKKSTYKNLVDILDEMAICKVPTYAIVNEFSPEENKLAEEINK